MTAPNLPNRPDEDPEGCDIVRAMLRYAGEDPDREGLVETPKRVIKAMGDHFKGYRENPEAFLQKTFSEVEGYNELVLISDIELHSHCEHHMVPFVGKAHVAYIPNGRVVGLSKLARVVEHIRSGSRFRRSSPHRSPARSGSTSNRRASRSSSSASTSACATAA